MSDHEFAFIVSGVDAHAHDFEDRFFEAGCGDATLMLVNGLVAVCFNREAENFTHAVASAYADVLKTGAKIERFEPDFLVSRTEIAKRSGLTKAAISNYASGERGRDFPAPHARITSPNPLWDWVEVSSWLHRNGLLSADDVVNARISRAINWAVQSLSRTAHATDMHLVDLVKDAAREPVLA